MLTKEMSMAQERPSYWKETQHSMTRRNKLNNYHAGHKAYMVTLKIEGMVPLLGKVVPISLSSATRCGTQDGTHSATRCGMEAACRLYPLGEAMQKAWLTLPERFHNISIIDSPEEFVIMPEHFHGIIYVTGYMEEHLSDVIRLFKARVTMAYRKMLVEYAEKGAAAIGYPENAFRPVGTSERWLAAYQSQPQEIKTATRGWIEGQIALLFSATRCGTQQDSAPFRVTASGKREYRVTASGNREKQGFLFATGFTDGLLLKTEDLDGHREYILRNPDSRLLRSSNRTLLKANRSPIDTAVSITALERYLLSECSPMDVTPEKLEAVNGLLLVSSATRCGTQGGIERRQMIHCWSYGDRELLKRRLLPVVCHRKDLGMFQRQKTRCLEEARSGAIIVSACISKLEREIFNAVKDAGFPVVRIEDNGFPGYIIHLKRG